MKVEKQITTNNATKKSKEIVSNQGIQNLKSSLKPNALKEAKKVETNQPINPTLESASNVKVYCY